MTLEVDALLERRWAVVRHALDPATAAVLADSAPDRWQAEESAPDSTVTSSSLRTGSAVVDAADKVRDLADAVVADLDAGSVEIPAFNEVTWNKYQPAKGHISLHRDPPAAGGVIAVFTLYGEAMFTVENEGEFPVSAGDLVLIAGNGWPQPQDRCVRHAASKPTKGERMILTFRHNINGAGGPWF